MKGDLNTNESILDALTLSEAPLGPKIIYESFDCPLANTAFLVKFHYPVFLSFICYPTIEPNTTLATLWECDGKFHLMHG